MKNDSHKHTECRVCGGPLVPFIDMGSQPPANALRDTQEEALNVKRYPLHLMHCESCNLGQLDTVVDPEVLYSDYVYRSSVSETFRQHCAALTTDVFYYLLTQASEIRGFLDIAGNDGCLAREFARTFEGRSIYVFDPAQDDAPAPYTKIKQFWNQDTAAAFRETHGKMNIITAQNVVGHVDGVKDFFHAVRDTLVPYGVFIVEVPSYMEMCDRSAFETVYHEHLSYWSVSAMIALAGRTGFDVQGVTFFPDLHCGTLRFYLTPGSGFKSGKTALDAWRKETEFFSGNWREQYAQRWADRVEFLAAELDESYRVGITASAKAITLLNSVGASPLALLDDSPSKQWKFAPGCGSQIEPLTLQTLAGNWPVILSQNLTEPLLRKLRGMGYRGPVLLV